MKVKVKVIYEAEDYEAAENMSLEEVIARLKAIARGYLPDYTYTHDGSEDEYERFANQMAMCRAEEELKKLLGCKYEEEGNE